MSFERVNAWQPSAAGVSYQHAVTGLVLTPLGMADSSFPMSWPEDPPLVTGYRLLPDGLFAPALRHVCTVPAAEGLWSTTADLVRFATGWSALLPDALAREALTPQADRSPNGQMGLGWMLYRDNGAAGHPGASLGSTTFLLMHLDSGQTCVAMTNRQVPIETVNTRVIRALPPIPAEDAD